MLFCRSPVLTGGGKELRIGTEPSKDCPFFDAAAPVQISSDLEKVLQRRAAEEGVVVDEEEARAKRWGRR